jgi:multiple sugar transport system permease protein
MSTVAATARLATARQRRLRAWTNWAVRLIVLGIVLFVTLVPVAWIVLTSLKPRDEWIHDPPVWFPSVWTVASYREMWSSGGGLALKNSLIIVCTSTVLAIVLGSVAAYSLSRFRTGGDHVASWILSIKFLPAVVFAIPLLNAFTKVHLVDTYKGLILLYTTFNLPFVVWMMKGFFDEVPAEIEESARVDGCSWFGSFWRIALPLAMPGFIATLLLTFIFGWNEFLFALIFTNQDHYTIPVQLSSYFSEAVGLEWGPQAALSVLGIAPIILFSFLIQRFLVRGMTFGAVKA